MAGNKQIPIDIANDEYLYRGVVTANWDYDLQRPSSATFKDTLGVSVDRSAGRDNDDCVNKLLSVKHFKSICRVTAGKVREINAVPKYLPVSGNIYHSEIHDSGEKVQLSRSKARCLRDVSEITYTDDAI